jgi:TPP-dependent pyruvate/acetoin dehydrogenase alpha subunit
LEKERLLKKMHYWLTFIRAFEERISILYRQGKVLGGVYSGMGQEAIVVGTCIDLKKEDFIFPLHRDIGANLVKGIEPKILMAQLLGKKTGLSKGKDSYLHAGDIDLGVIGSTSMLGSSLPVAAGVGLAFKLKKKDNVVIAFFGEGASNRGDFHEALNLAGVWKLPVIFVCENNFFAYSTPIEAQMAIEDVADRASSYGFSGVVCSGNDLMAVYKTAKKAIDKARAGEGPTLIECKTYRWHGHSEHDEASYRAEDEFLEWKSRDPIPRFELYLEELKILDKKLKESIDKDIREEIDQAVKFAEESPFPEGKETLDDIYK